MKTGKKRKLVAAFLSVCVWLSGCFLMSGCSTESEGGQASDNVGPKIICKADDFEKVKGEWYGADSLVSSQAQEIATTDLVVGERYYFVYTFGLDSVFDDYSSTYMGYDLKFGVKTWDGLYEDAASVIFEPGTLPTDGEISATIDEKGTVEAGVSWEAAGTRAYVAVPFTPKRAGMLFIDSFVSFESYAPLNDTVPRVFANVLAEDTDVNNTSIATISNLSYGLVSQATYESGALDSTTNLAAISQISPGRNYVVVDFDVAAESGNGGEVYCGIYLHSGKWEDVTLEEANTAKYNLNHLDDGQSFEFSYSVPSGGTKRIRTVLSFTVLDMCAIDLEFFVYSDNTRVTGTMYDYDYFSDASISKLTYRVEQDEHKCYVSGYETMTGKVVVPNYYEEYPVVGIDVGAFEGCTQLQKIDVGGRTQTIGDNAFKNCTALESVCMPSALEVIGYDAFAGCSSLVEAVFEEPYVWEIASKDPLAYSMGDPYYSAQILVNNEVYLYLRRLPLIGIQNVSVGFVDEATYNSGDYDDKITRDWDTMEYYQPYYWIVDFDMEVPSPPQGYGLSLDFLTIGDYSFVLKEASDTNCTFFERSSSDDYGTYSVFMQDLKQTTEPVHQRLVFEVIPDGDRHIQIAFSASCYITSRLEESSTYYHKSIVYEEIEIDIW